jgi:hypothetical protein
MRLFADATCQLGGGTVVTPGSLRPWLDEAWVERLDFRRAGGRRRVRRRLFAGATRRAVELRDGECFHRYCDTPAEQCEADHIEPHAGRWAHDPGQLAGCPRVPQSEPASKSLTAPHRGRRRGSITAWLCTW